MNLGITLSESLGAKIYYPETIDELESLLGHKVILLEKLIPNAGVCGLINIFKTAQKSNMYLDIREANEKWNFLIRAERKFDGAGLKSKELKAWNQINNTFIGLYKWSQEDKNMIKQFFMQLPNHPGWPSKTDNPSGKGRYNNI